MPLVPLIGGAFGPLAVVTLPSDRDSLLEQILPERQKLYRLIRRVLDELDEAAPWEQLYYPPHEAEEFRRNAGLARALRRTLDAIGELQAAVPFQELRERWRGRARVDPYALADLATFRGILGRLLKRDLRRGFYSGDYHQIQRREAVLATRAAALEATHHRTWAEPADAPGIAEAYADLERLTLQAPA